MLPLLALALIQAGTDSVVVRTREVAARYADTASARQDGFGPLRVGRITDLTPFQGQHWVHRWRVFNGSEGLRDPSFVMYAPVGGAWRPVGLAYSERIAPGAPVPSDLAGARAPWHLHQPCVVVPGEGAALADGEADCLARGGLPRPPAIAMVHAWTIANPEGPFAHDNIAIPYLVSGLDPPGRADLSSPARARRVRALGLALGESYGAIMPYARLVEAVSTMPGLADSLARRRAVIVELAGRLRTAEKGGDRAARARLEAAAIREWEALRRLYRLAAPSPAIAAQLERQHARALGEDPGHHMH